MRTTLAAVLCAALAAGAFAQDADPETRFHRAYEQEVVEGKVADAARVYLAMMGDEKIPPRLRAEAKFRFAVTSILLGRADEGRAHLAELVKDANTSETLRARATEYLDAAKGIGVGSELDKKLQALVFDLAQESPISNDTPKSYRDFEVIGHAAVPFLRQLLQHSDVALRQHAFRILLRIDEPGTMRLFTPEMASAARELSSYLKDHPDELSILEERLRSLEDKVFAVALSSIRYRSPTSFTPGFLREAATRGAPPEVIVFLLDRRGDRDADELRLEWIRSSDVALSRSAVLSLLRSSRQQVATTTPVAELFPGLVDRLLAADLAWEPRNWHAAASPGSSPDIQSYEGFRKLAHEVPASKLLDGLEKALATQAASPPDLTFRRWPSGFLEALAFAIDDAEPSGDDVVRYAALLRRWIEDDSSGAAVQHVRPVLEGLSSAQATEFVRWFLARPVVSPDWTWILPQPGPNRVPLFVEAFRAATTADLKFKVLGHIGIAEQNSAEALTTEYARAVLAVAPDLVREWSRVEVHGRSAIAGFARFALRIPPAEAQERLLATAAAVLEPVDPSARNDGLNTLLPRGEAPVWGAYWIDVALPALDRLIELPGIDMQSRRKVVGHLVSQIQQKTSGDGLRVAAAPFVLAHVDLLEVPYVLVEQPAIFPPTAWVPRVAARWFTDVRMRVDRAVADPAVRELTRDPANVNASVLAFAAQSASPEVAGEALDRFLRTASTDHLASTVNQLVTTSGASADAKEAALAKLTAADHPDVPAIARVVDDLTRSHPSERLLPAVRLLLAGTSHVRVGIQVAKSLGREELLPDLGNLLDSMDGKLRQEAREAIDSIVELRRLKEEARRRTKTGEPR